MDSGIKISVLIVTYNNARTIRACIDSLATQTLSEFEILVRDNASVDDTVSILNSLNNIKTFACEENIGFGAAMNYLAEKARGEYLFTLNPDCVCPANLLQSLYDFTQAYPGAVAPALVYPDGVAQPSARDLPTHSTIIYSRRSPLYLLGLAGTKSAGYVSPIENSKVGAVPGTALLIKTEVFRNLGGFDERFFMYGEDLDISKRLGDAGHDIWYLPDLKIEHVLGESTKGISLKTSYHHHASIMKYFLKHHSSKVLLNLVLFILLAGGFCFSVIMKVMRIKRRQ